MESSEQDSVIRIKVKGTKPLKYQWHKDDRKLCDSVDYKGSNASELEIVGTGLQVNGNYKCQVINMYGEVWSQEIYYGELSLK